jgi:signal transduction histidine kinase/CheY-like chemotaxis protein/PAS domain-containing protein
VFGGGVPHAERDSGDGPGDYAAEGGADDRLMGERALSERGLVERGATGVTAAPSERFLAGAPLERFLATLREPTEVSTLEGRVLFVNDAMAQLRDATPDELIGSTACWVAERRREPDRDALGAVRYTERPIDRVKRGLPGFGETEMEERVYEMALFPLAGHGRSSWASVRAEDAAGEAGVTACLAVVLGTDPRNSDWELAVSAAREGAHAGGIVTAHADSASPTNALMSAPVPKPAPLPQIPVSLEAPAPEGAGATPVSLADPLLENLGRMATGFAHDFNNMLSVIDASAELALRRIDPGAPGREQLLQIRDAAQRSARLTKQLLALGRGAHTSPELLDINAVVFGLEQLLSVVLTERIELVTELAAPSAHVRIARSRLEQVLLNLAVNARDAMPEGGRFTLRTYALRPDLELATVPLPGSSRSPGEPLAGDAEGVCSAVMLEVSDSGMGMSAEVAARIFEPHYTTKGAGSGIGLAIVDTVVTEAGGTVALHSEPGVGTTFFIRLPCEQASRVSRPPSVRPHRSRVLVVDDEAPVRRAVAKMVAQNGFDVFVARDAGEALDLLGRERVDLILTDVVMPGMSGVALAEVAAERFPGVAVVFMSGYAHDVILERGLDPSSMIYLQKPFTRLELLRKIGAALGEETAVAAG